MHLLIMDPCDLEGWFTSAHHFRDTSNTRITFTPGWCAQLPTLISFTNLCFRFITPFNRISESTEGITALAIIEEFSVVLTFPCNTRPIPDKSTFCLLYTSRCV